MSTIIQYVSEKIGGAKGTELDDEFLTLEKVNDFITSNDFVVSMSPQDVGLLLS